MTILYKRLALSPSRYTPDQGLPALAHIGNVKTHIRQLLQGMKTQPSLINGNIPDALKLEQEILTDSLAYLELSLNKTGHSFLANAAQRDPFMTAFLDQLSTGRINFSRAVQAGAALLQLPPPPHFPTWIHQHPGFHSNALLRTELDLFINRGNFEWTSYEESDFARFVHSTQPALPENAHINCWEAMLNSLMNSGAINRRDVAHIYDPNSHPYDVLENLSKAFRWVTAKHITRKDLFIKASAYNPYFIEISPPGAHYLGGLAHDMISFPNSSDKVLQTLVSGQLQGLPDNTLSIYSNWERWTDSRLGTANTTQAITYMLLQEAHIIPLTVFIHKFPKVVKAVQGATCKVQR